MLTQVSFIKVFTNDPDLIRKVLDVDGVLSCGGLVDTAAASPIHAMATVRPGRDCWEILKTLHKIPVEALVVRDGRGVYF